MFTGLPFGPGNPVRLCFVRTCILEFGLWNVTTKKLDQVKLNFQFFKDVLEQMSDTVTKNLIFSLNEIDIKNSICSESKKVVHQLL